VPNILEIIPQRVPLIDQRTGLVSREWYRFFFELFTKIGPTTFSIEDLQVGPQNSEALADAISIAQQAQLLSLTQSQVDELAKQVEALALAPPTTPHLRNRAYGTFYDTTTQTAAAINTAYALTFNSTNLSNGVYIGSPASRIYVEQRGVYDLQFSAQLDNTSGGSHLIYIWLRINGTDVANSAGQVRLKGTDGELVTSWNYVEQLNAGDYFELVWSVSDTSVQILSQAAAAPVPAIPSIILTVTDNISAYQD
jgi:hemoglobin-like flavoprotein